MTRRSIIECAEAVRGRYFRASEKIKTEILNEFVATTGMPHNPHSGAESLWGFLCVKYAKYRLRCINTELAYGEG